MIGTTTNTPLTFGYTNHRGEYAVRQAIPLRVEHRVSEWHGDQPQHIMVGWDTEKQAERDFLIEDMVPLGNLRKRFERMTAENNLIEELATVLRWNAFEPKVHCDNAQSLWTDSDENVRDYYRDQAVVARDFMTAHFAGPAAGNSPHNFKTEGTISDSEKAEPAVEMSSQPLASFWVAIDPQGEPDLDRLCASKSDCRLTAAERKAGWRVADVDLIEERAQVSRNATPERVQELLEANNRYLEDMRAARRTAGAALLLADTWRTHGNELVADILRGVLAGEIEPRSDMVKHSAPGAARCVGPIEEGLRDILRFANRAPKHPCCEPIIEIADSLLKHNFPNPDAPAAEPKVEPAAASDQPEYSDQREPGEFGEGMTI